MSGPAKQANEYDLSAFPEFSRSHVKHWLSQEVNHGATSPTANDLRSIREWMESLQEETPNMMRNLHKLNWQSAKEFAEKWQNAQVIKTEVRAKCGGEPNDVKPVMEFSDGLRWVCITTEAGWLYEAAVKGHSPWRDDPSSIFYSLRDEMNMPLCTLEVSVMSPERSGLRDEINMPRCTLEVSDMSAERNVVLEVYDGVNGESPEQHQSKILALLDEIRPAYVWSAQSFGCQFIGLNDEPAKLWKINDLLQTLNRGDVVRGNLLLGGREDVTSLPDDLTIQGSLCLSGCANMKSLPRRLSVTKSVYLRDCDWLTEIPGDLVAGGGMELNGSSNLTDLPADMTVHGMLALRDCTSLAELPERLTVLGYLYLNGCTSLTSIPEDTEVAGLIFGADHLPRTQSRPTCEDPTP